jgi:hypothetical protein
MPEEIERLVLDFCGDALLSFSMNNVHEVVMSVSGLCFGSSLSNELQRIAFQIYTAEELDQIYDSAEEVLSYNTPEEAEQIFNTAYKFASHGGKTGYECQALTDKEIFDRCLLLLQKQREIEPSRPLPKLIKYDEKKHPHYRLCGDILLLLARNANSEDMASWAEHQLSDKSDRYADKDEVMKEVLEKLSLVAYPGFGLTEGEIFLLAVGLLAK